MLPIKKRNISGMKDFFDTRKIIFFEHILWEKNDEVLAGLNLMICVAGERFTLEQRFSNHGSRPNFGSRRTSVWVSGTIMGLIGRRKYFLKVIRFRDRVLETVGYMRVIWVAGRTRRPIIGSLQKSRENRCLRATNDLIEVVVYMQINHSLFTSSATYSFSVPRKNDFQFFHP